MQELGLAYIFVYLCRTRRQDTMERDTIKQLLLLTDECSKMRARRTAELLRLSDRIQELRKNSPHELYQLNIIDIIGCSEPNTSTIIANILKYSPSLVRSFTKEFIEECGFNPEWVKRPKISAENDHIDILIREREYAIIIENKLKGAKYQPNQIARYIAKMRNAGYTEKNIFIVILPIDYSHSYISDMRKSAWRLPPDWQAPKHERKCVIDAMQCWCDTNQHEQYLNNEHCKQCKDLQGRYKVHTTVIHLKFAEWLTGECLQAIKEKETTLGKEETILRSAIIQFADWLNGLYRTRINHKLFMDIVKFLEQELLTEAEDKDNTPRGKWTTLNDKLKDLEELKTGIEELQRRMAQNMIKEWGQKLKEKWPMLKCTENEFSVTLKGGVECGCYIGKHGQPYWEFRYKGNGSARQDNIINKILDAAYYTRSAWDYTLHGDERCDAFYEAARRLGYL